MKEKQPTWPTGIKKTKQRMCVFSILEKASSPISALDIYKQIEKENSAFWLSTVYRVLELFVNEGVARKTSIINSNMALYELNCNKHKHYAICVGCHKVVEMNNCPMETFIPKLADNSFRVLGHKVEMYGYCKDCDNSGI